MSSLTRVGWYWNQLRGISVAGFVERAGATAGRAMSRRPAVDSVPLPRSLRADAGPAWLPVAVPLRRGVIVRMADELLSGQWNVLSRPMGLGFPPDWNSNPINGVRVPALAGRSLASRDLASIGDHTYLYELNRHRELVVLAQAWRVTGSRMYLDAVGDLLISWFAECPYPHGANWSCPQEAGIRLLNWSMVWQLVGGATSPLFETPLGKVLRTDWLNSVWRHAEFIRGRPLRRATGDHQQIVEMAGLYLAAVTWPLWDEVSEWRDCAREELETALRQQVGGDGVSREQSLGVQQALLESLLLVVLASRHAGEDYSAGFSTRLAAMLEFVAAVMDAGGNVPQLGDSTGSPLTGLFLASGTCPFHALLATGALLFESASLARKAGVVDPLSEWLLGEEACRRFDALLLQGAPATPRTDFAEGGVFVLGSRLDTPDELRVVADAGSLGLDGVAAHGHADALSFTLSLAGREFLLDPGTATFLGPEAWRNGFRGTAMHNTLTVAGEDQAVSGGRFVWSRRYQVRVLERSVDAEEERLVAEHDGYRRLPGRPVHRRAWRLERKEGALSVVDRVSGFGEHDLRIHWHFSEDCSITRTPDGLQVCNGLVRLEMLPPPGGEVSLLQGSEVPLAGWVSRGYDQRRPATTVIWRAQVPAGQALETVFRRLA